MSGKNTAAFGIYPDQVSVSEGVEALKNAGFRNTDISVLFPENTGSKDFAHEKHTKAPEGAVAGASSGAILGGALGCWPESELSRFPALGLSLRPVLS